MRRLVAVCALAGMIGAAGCGGESAGGDGVLPVGRFTYRASHPIPDAADSIRLAGVMEIRAAEGDSVTGRWNVPRMQPELRAAAGEGGAVEILGQPTYFGTLVHRVARAEGGGLSCSGRYLWVAADGAERSVPVTCSLEAEVPAGAGVPPADDPMVSPIDADTVPG